MIRRLVLTDFRNHADLSVAADTGFVLLHGDNGVGKTNVLEAVSLLAPGRGLRAARLSEVARAGGPGGGPGGFGVAARLADDTELATGALAAAPERRQVRINGAPAPAAALAERLSVLWLTPATDRLFTEGPGARRRFLDRLVLALDPRHGVHSVRYEAAMRERNRLLAAEKEGSRADPAWLDALEARMAEHGAAVAAARADAVAVLGDRIAAQPPGPFARGGLAIDGGGGGEGDLLRRLRADRARDAAAGRALAGPHRADLIVTHLDKAMPAALASTGEQKALLIGLVLAHAALVADRVGMPPILLLDEVAAHLDPSRRAALFDRLAAGGGQVWMTGTEPALFDAIGPATRLALASPA